MPAKSKLGQNFLRDAAAIDRIVAALGDCSARTVVEIGPGEGAITRPLSRRARHLIAVEADPALAQSLRSSLPAEHVRVVERDVLAFDFASATGPQRQKLLVAGNLPYYITSPILLHLAAGNAAIERAVLMVQREVADRVTAAPGSRDYGLLSVTVQMYGAVEPLFTLAPEAFSPPPEVHSTVFRWIMKPRFAEFGVEEKQFLQFARQAFAQKRKTLANNLRAVGYTPAVIAAALAHAGAQPQVRAEALGLAQLCAVWKALAQKI